jgi:vitamin B12 transporter
MTKKQSLLAACLCAPFSCLIFGPAVAQNTETIVVTATRTPQPTTKVGSSVSVISAPDIVAAQSIAVSDLLRDVPGVTISRNGGVGSFTSVRIRGAESDQTVLLVDGIKLNDPSGPSGGYDFANLLVGDIEKIEVLRGPQSTLYGSQALGGVVNIITRSGDTPFGAHIDLEAGNLSSLRARGGVRGKIGGLSYSGSLSHFETDGISAAAVGKERDSFSHDGAQLRLNYALTDTLDVEARAFWSNSDVGIDGFPPPTYAFSDTPERSQSEELIAYLGANLSLLDGRSRTRLGISQTTTDRVSTDPSLSLATTFLATGTNQRAEIQSVLDLTPNVQIVAGGDIEEARLKTSSPSSFDPNPTPLRAKSALSALYVQAQASPTSWLTATLGARKTDNDRFGEALNLRATLAASFNQGNTIVRAALADGFKAPTPYQLFSEYGNVRLSPEEAGSVEIGVEQAFFDRRLIGALTSFQRDTTNQIDFVSCFGDASAKCNNRPFGTYDNIAKARAKGVEAVLEAKPTPRLSFTLGYSHLDARNRVIGSANFNRRLARRPQDTGFASIAYKFGFGLDLSATYSQTGDSFNNPSNSVRLDGYELITLRASQRINETWSIYGRIENASDASYQTSAGYGSLPRQSFVGLRGTF